MKRVFLDTNILLDILLKRDDYVSAAQILALSNNSEYSIHISVLTIANIAYILRKVLVGDQLYDGLVKLTKKVNVEPLTNSNLQSALCLKAKDFEDSLQYFCAISADCDVIVTRNVKDFSYSRLPILTPKELLSLIN